MQRRSFVIGSASVAGGVLIGGYRLLRPLDYGNPLTATLGDGEFALTPYVIVDGSGVSIVAPRAEMGQGIHSTLAALVAEELDVSLADVRVIHGPPSEAYSNTVAYPLPTERRALLELRVRTRLERPARSTQLTGGQSSTQDAFVKMRKAGAAARAMLVEAAAREFGVDPSVLKTARGAVLHPDGTALPYTRLAEAAARVKPPEDPPLKPREQWTLLGRSQPRVDMVGKCTGTAEYSIDVRLPGMVYGVVRRNPRIGAPMESYDASKAEAAPGFRQIVPLEDGIVVVATNTWYAMRAANMIDIEWGPAPYPETSEDHREVLVDAIDNDDGREWRNDGDVHRALEGSEVIEGMYHVPYLAHATMEPLNAVAWLRDGELDIWAGNQSPTHTQRIGSRIADVPLASVRVHTTFMGGGFGRRLEMDFIETAVHAARAMPGTPVLVTWPREEDMTHDAYRPMASARFRATLAGDRPVALDLRMSSPNLGSSARRRDGRPADQAVREGIDKFSATGAMDQPYRIDHYRVTAGRARRLLPVGWWRSVGESQNTFFHESAIDEIAHAAGSDPLEMRLSLLDHAPSRAVLEAVAEMSNWGSDLPAGHARGVAYALSSGAATAQVVEVVHRDGQLRIEKSFAAVDVGIALDPRNIEGQVISGVLFGLCAAMHGEITVTGGRVEQTNFHDYTLMRMAQAPPVEVRIHESRTAIYGVGEAGTPTAAPALGNAIYAATGQRIRELPFGKSVRFV